MAGERNDRAGGLGGRRAVRRAAALALAALGCATVAAPGTAAAQEAQADLRSPQDKSQYTLFNPVPRDMRRELSPDRPDRTESPFTVDAGHVQVELSFV